MDFAIECSGLKVHDYEPSSGLSRAQQFARRGLTSVLGSKSSSSKGLYAVVALSDGTSSQLVEIGRTDEARFKADAAFRTVFHVRNSAARTDALNPVPRSLSITLFSYIPDQAKYLPHGTAVCPLPSLRGAPGSCYMKLQSDQTDTAGELLSVHRVVKYAEEHSLLHTSGETLRSALVTRAAGAARWVSQEQSSCMSLPARVPALLLALRLGELRQQQEIWRCRYNRERLRQGHFDGDDEAVAHGYCVLRVTVRQGVNLVPLLERLLLLGRRGSVIAADGAVTTAGRGKAEQAALPRAVSPPPPAGPSPSRSACARACPVRGLRLREPAQDRSRGGGEAGGRGGGGRAGAGREGSGAEARTAAEDAGEALRRQARAEAARTRVCAGGGGAELFQCDGAGGGGGGGGGGARAGRGRGRRRRGRGRGRRG
jgi:hypothetical protein